MNWWLNVKREATKWVAVLIAGIIVGLTMAWTLWIPKTKVMEKPKPSVIQEDGSRIIKKEPVESVKPPHQIPKGGVVERFIHLEAKPHGPSSAGTTPIPGSDATALPLLPSQQPFRIDLSMVRMSDGTLSTVVSSPDGEITDMSFDAPVQTASKLQAKDLKWAAGGVYGITAWGDKAVGAFIDRDFAFIRTGVELTKNTYALDSRTGWEVRAKIGLRF